MEIHEMPEKEFKIIIIRLFKELKHRIPLNEIRKMTHKQSEIINETETQKKNQAEILELKKTLSELKISPEELNLTRQEKNQQMQRLNQEGGKNKSIEMKNVKDLWNTTIKQNSVCIMRIPEERERGRKIV